MMCGQRDGPKDMTGAHEKRRRKVGEIVEICLNASMRQIRF